MNKDPYDLTPVPQKDIFTYTDMTEEDFKNLVDNLFDKHARKIGDHWVYEDGLDFLAAFGFARDLRAVLAAANGPLQATTSKPLPVIPWSGSKLTEMEELLQKVQQLETENADISHAYGVTRDVVKGLCEELANLKAENAALRKEKDKLELERCEMLRSWDLTINHNAALVEAFAKADVLAEHSRFDGRREWTVVETWVYPNDIIVQMDRAAFDAARKEGQL